VVALTISNPLLDFTKKIIAISFPEQSWFVVSNLTFPSANLVEFQTWYTPDAGTTWIQKLDKIQNRSDPSQVIFPPLNLPTVGQSNKTTCVIPYIRIAVSNANATITADVSRDSGVTWSAANGIGNVTSVIARTGSFNAFAATDFFDPINRTFNVAAGPFGLDSIGNEDFSHANLTLFTSTDGIGWQTTGTFFVDLTKPLPSSLMGKTCTASSVMGGSTSNYLTNPGNNKGLYQAFQDGIQLNGAPTTQPWAASSTATFGLAFSGNTFAAIGQVEVGNPPGLFAISKDGTETWQVSTPPWTALAFPNGICGAWYL